MICCLRSNERWYWHPQSIDPRMNQQSKRRHLQRWHRWPAVISCHFHHFRNIHHRWAVKNRRMQYPRFLFDLKRLRWWSEIERSVNIFFTTRKMSKSKIQSVNLKALVWNFYWTSSFDPRIPLWTCRRWIKSNEREIYLQIEKGDWRKCSSFHIVSIVVVHLIRFSRAHSHTLYLKNDKFTFRFNFHIILQNILHFDALRLRIYSQCSHCRAMHEIIELEAKLLCWWKVVQWR